MIDIDAISNSVQQSDHEYIAEDGLLHCSICGCAIQTKIHIFGTDRIVRCICDCEKNRQEKIKERERIEQRERRRRECFGKAELHACNFEMDDGQKQKITDALEKYCDQFKSDFKKSGQGLLLYGGIGTGKTFYSACIANRLIDLGQKCFFTDFRTIANVLFGAYDKQEIIDHMNSYDLLVLDDLGADTGTDYKKELVLNAIDSRTKSGLPMIITTNLSLEDLKNPVDMWDKRTFDRVLQKCHAIKVDGASRRREEVRKSYFEINEKLGL